MTIPFWGDATLQAYGVGLADGTMNDMLRVSVRVLPDESSPAIAVRPSAAELALQNASSARGRGGSLTLDVIYNLQPGRTANPGQDLSVAIPGLDLVGIRPEENGSLMASRFAGQVILQFVLGRDVKPGSTLPGSIQSPGAEAATITVTIGSWGD